MSANSTRSLPTSTLSAGADRHPRALRAGYRMRTLPLLPALLVAVACGDSSAPGGSTGFGRGDDAPYEQITRPAAEGSVHLVRLVQRGDQYAFEPSDLTIPSGDVVRFVATGAQPESVAFEPGRATPAAAEYIRARSLHLGTLLTDPGQAYDVAFTDAPAGAYPFQSIPHAQRGMRGTITIVE